MELGLIKNLINLIVKFISGNIKKTPQCSVESVAVSQQLINFEDYVTASGKYPERLNSPELTDEVRANAKSLLEKVNGLLMDLNITEVKVSSGFRPSDVNKDIGGAKKSQHMIGSACDIVDMDGRLDKLCEENDALLKKHGLWQEAPASTQNWCHLDQKDRGKRDKNQFIP